MAAKQRMSIPASGVAQQSRRRGADSGPIAVATLLSSLVLGALILFVNVSWRNDSATLPPSIDVRLHGDPTRASLPTPAPLEENPKLPDPAAAAAEPLAHGGQVGQTQRSTVAPPSEPPTVTPRDIDTRPVPMRLAAATFGRALTPARTGATATNTVALAYTRDSANRQVRMPEAEATLVASKLDDWLDGLDMEAATVAETTFVEDGQQYRALLRHDAASADTTLDRVLVEVSKESGYEALSTTVEYRRLAFSSYAQFVNRWDRDVQIHDDVLDGRFHSNSMINLTYSRKAGPRFLGRVTTVAHRINMIKPAGRKRRADMFLDGVETGVRRIHLPANAVPLPDDTMLAAGRVHYFDTDTRIRFLPEGSFMWVSIEDGLFERRETVAAPTTYLIGHGGADLEIEGTVSGSLLVYSDANVIITGDLRYANGPEGDDYLGIVAERRVDIADRRRTGPGDLTVHAAIYAKRQFRVRGYQRRDDATLTLFGSLTAGSLTATEPRFATHIRFDPRLEERRPPGFPMTDRFEQASWDRVWTRQLDRRR